MSAIALPGADVQVRRGIALVQLDVAGLDGQPAAGRHGVPGVDRQVQQDLLDLAGVGLDRPQPVGGRGG